MKQYTLICQSCGKQFKSSTPRIYCNDCVTPKRKYDYVEIVRQIRSRDSNKSITQKHGISSSYLSVIRATVRAMEET